ncbi:hypothetical protein [Blastococcus sp. LR1]|uniref:hypothetical protein n=1 Tax=Blastococcus sp. LR1 TaxID=2877000 RepID=UPI001CC900DB|nr:hypothetical protein [Blastococcus sp. LR1]MCA0144548.1 hypothetical protein [Blastococcus sp. LR1]
MLRRKRLKVDDPRLVWPSWSVDLPGLSEANAKRVIAWSAKEQLAIGGSPVDPAVSFTSHIDRAMAESLRDGLRIALDSKALSEEQRDLMAGFAETLDDWLANATD